MAAVVLVGGLLATLPSSAALGGWKYFFRASVSIVVKLNCVI